MLFCYVGDDSRPTKLINVSQYHLDGLTPALPRKRPPQSTAFMLECFERNSTVSEEERSSTLSSSIGTATESTFDSDGNVIDAMSAPVFQPQYAAPKTSQSRTSAARKARLNVPRKALSDLYKLIYEDYISRPYPAWNEACDDDNDVGNREIEEEDAYQYKQFSNLYHK